MSSKRLWRKGRGVDWLLRTENARTKKVVVARKGKGTGERILPTGGKGEGEKNGDVLLRKGKRKSLYSTPRGETAPLEGGGKGGSSIREEEYFSNLTGFVARRVFLSLRVHQSEKSSVLACRKESSSATKKTGFVGRGKRGTVCQCLRRREKTPHAICTM